MAHPKYPNLFHPIRENAFNRATNDKFTLASLFMDKKHVDEGPKTEHDVAARHFIRNGEIPESYRQKYIDPKPNHDHEDGEENIKEETKMPFFQIQEGCVGGTCEGKPGSAAKSSLLVDPAKASAGNNAAKATGLLSKLNGSKVNEECACGKPHCNCGAEKEGTGVCKSDGLLHKIPINQYQDSDSNFVGDGEQAETSKTNIPSLLAAKTAGGSPDPKTVSNGINQKASNAEVFKVKPVADNGF